MRVITLWKAHHDGAAEIFVRPSAAQLAHLNQGWVVTVLSEAVPDDAETSPTAGKKAAVPVAPLPAASQLFKTLEIQER
jgi:hypothetical protein